MPRTVRPENQICAESSAAPKSLIGNGLSGAQVAKFWEAHLYHHGEQWLQFLEDPDIPATNHRAEQALKTPIVNRKVWGGNRTDTGVHAQVVTLSVLETCKKMPRPLNKH